MIQIVWQYQVKEEARDRFELAYGPGGAWSSLFAKCPGFRGTVLLRETKDLHRYLTIDTWDSEADRDAMLDEHQAEYAALDASFREWTEAETEIGIFRLLAEASVRPKAKVRRRGRRSD
jgi:heme-degrading monooxygenase HmoA